MSDSTANASGERGQRATIYDIAELAGVNPSTVSRALTKPGRVSAQTERRVRDAARTLRYRVNPMARALPTGRSQMLGVIVADITNPMFSPVVRGAEDAARTAGYMLVLAESCESGELEIETTERVAPSVDGLILVASRLTDEQIRSLAGQYPLAVINRQVEGVVCVTPDIEPGIQQALDHLRACGHRSIAYLSGPTTSWMSLARWESLLSLAVERGLNIVEIGPGRPTLEGGRETLTRVRAAGVTGVLAYNDLMAIGLLHAAQGAGLSVPDDLSIIGFDDIFGSDFTTPTLSTVRAPLHLAGECSVRRLLAHTDDEGTPEQPLATEFVRRGSSGPLGTPTGDPSGTAA